MAFSSYASSDNPLPSASSIIASVLPSVYDTSVISDAFVREQDLVEASKHYSLVQVNMNSLAPIAYSFPPVFLGSGASYRVYMRKLPQWSEFVAVKYIKSKSSPGLVENVPSVELQRTTILREILVLGQFKNHPNIITLLGWGQSGDNLNPTNVDWSINNNVCLITEYAPLGNLQSFLQGRGYSLQSNQLLKISAGVAEGIRALHSQAIIHGDIKTANILVFEQPPGSSQYTPKISDLGYSIILGLGDEDNHYCGTDLYNAPEIRSKGPEKVQGIDLLACDIYSLGLLIWTVFQHGRFFLDGIADRATENGLEVQILDSVGPFRVLEYALQFARAQTPQKEATNLESAFPACLAVDPAARLSISNICQILDPSAPAILGNESREHMNHTFHYQPNKTKALDVFERGLAPSYGLRQRLAKKILQSARNPKHPKAADVAYEASKCFAIGFGVSRDVVAMEYWLGEAARRGHDFASALVMTMSNTRRNSGHNGTLGISNALAAHATTFLIKKNIEQNSRGTRNTLEGIQRSELFSFNSLAETESHFRKRISQGLGFNASTVLHFAAALGRIDLLQICLQYGADVDYIDLIYECTPLVVALRAGQVEAAEILLRNGARIDLPNRFGYTAGCFLFTVPPKRFDDIITLFQNAPSGTLSGSRLLMPSSLLADLDSLETNETPLSFAAACRHIQVVRTYLFDFEWGYEFTTAELSYALDMAVASHDATICEMILRKVSISKIELPNPFICITERSIYDLILLHGEHRAEALHSTIEVLLSHGFDINSCEREPFIPVIYVAVSCLAYGHEAAAALLDHGASLSTERSCEFSVLQAAIAAVADSDEEGCVRWVLAQGAPFTLSAQEDDSNDTHDPLYFACSVNAHGAAKAILDYPGADVNVICEHGTPLHMACARDAVNMVELLLEHGADVSAIADNIWTPLEMAVMLGSIEVVRLFLAKDLPLYNTHGTLSRSILAFCARSLNAENTRTMQILLQHPRLRQAEVLGEIDEQGRTIVDYAMNAGKLEFALDLLDAGAKMSNPHDRESGWRSLAYSPQRVQFYNAGDPQQTCQYDAALEKAVQQMKSQDLIEVLNDKGETILHLACILGSVGAVKVLLDAGALACIAARDGTTLLSAALLNACLYGSHIPEDWPTDRVVVWMSAKNKALLTMLDLLLNAGADANVANRAKLKPLGLAILAAWRLKSAACVELLCAHLSDHSSISGSSHLGRSLHLVLEAPAYYRAFMWRTTPLDEEAEDAYLDTLKLMVRTLSNAGAVFDSVHFGLSKSTTLAEVLCQCSPTGLRAMLEEGVELYKALGTGHTAFLKAAHWLKAGGKLAKERNDEKKLLERFRDGYVEDFMERRKLRGMENLRTVQEYDRSPLWIKVGYRLEAILQGKGPSVISRISKMLDGFSYRETALLDDIVKSK